MSYKVRTNRPDIPYETVVEKFGLNELRNIVEDMLGSRLCVTYGTPVLTDRICVVACTIRDTITGTQLTRPGSVTLEEREPECVDKAYNRAFSKACKAFLKLSVTEYEEAEESALPDDTVILLGNLKGKRVGDVKETPQFAHFLEQLEGAGTLSFPDEARNKQVQALLAYAAERREHEQEEQLP